MEPITDERLAEMALDHRGKFDDVEAMIARIEADAKRIAELDSCVCSEWQKYNRSEITESGMIAAILNHIRGINSEEG